MTPTRLLAEWLLPRYAAGALPAPLRRVVQRALAADPRLAARYDALRRAERTVAGAPGLTSAQIELLLADVLDRVDAEAVPAPRPLLPALVPGALATAAAIAFFIVRVPDAGIRQGDALGELRARAALVQSAPVGVRVRCVMDDRVYDDAVVGARQTGADVECGDDGLLAFSTTNLASAARYVFVVGVDEEGERVWLPQFRRTAAARAIAPGAVDVVLDTLLPMSEVDADHLTLHVLLSDQPFDGAAVERRLDAAARSAVPLGRLDRLPVDVPLQARLVLHRVR